MYAGQCAGQHLTVCLFLRDMVFILDPDEDQQGRSSYCAVSRANLGFSKGSRVSLSNLK